jgi:hypothetical protein
VAGFCCRSAHCPQYGHGRTDCSRRLLTGIPAPQARFLENKLNLASQSLHCRQVLNARPADILAVNQAFCDIATS